MLRSVGASLGTQVSAAVLVGSVTGASALPADGGYSEAFALTAGVAAIAGLVALAIPVAGVAGRGDRAGVRYRAMTEQQVGPRRADAVRNRARVIAAAAEVFAERGLDASVPEVAARAGVGKATVYRSFPTKEHLVAAVVIEHLHDFEARIRAALEAGDAWTAFVDPIVEQTQAQMDDRARVGGLARTIHLPDLDAARSSMWAALEQLMVRARAAGAMRADATTEDLRVLWAGSTHFSPRRRWPTRLCGGDAARW